MRTRRVEDEGAISAALSRVIGGNGDRRVWSSLARMLSLSARGAGKGAVFSGKWLSDLTIQLAPRIPVRTQVELEALFHKSGSSLAAELIRDASRKTAIIGMTAGAVVSAEEFAPPAWLTIPIELVVETLVVGAIEMKLVAELHATYGVMLGTNEEERGMAMLRCWADGRGLSPAAIASPVALREALGKKGRAHLVRLVRRKVAQRLGRNLATLAPMFVGAVAGAAINRRGTKHLGDRVLSDLIPVVSLPPA